MKTRILIVEDQSVEANNLKLILRKAGYHVCSLAATVAEALMIAAEERPDLCLLDIQLKGKQTGIDLAEILSEKGMAFVYLSANSDAQTLGLAKATHPYGFLLKPFRQKDVLVSLDVALYLHRQKLSLPAAAKRLQASDERASDLIGDSPAMRRVFEELDIVAETDTSVLILGETGTGKELIASAIHRMSKRSGQPFVVVNCGALPPNLIESHLFGHEKGAFTGASERQTGKFEQANGGTIFLDEIGELPVEVQVKFLRVLQEREIEPIGGRRRPVDVRVIAATNRDLEEEMASGRFRMDLYYRLHVFPINLPALRDRAEDILTLAQYFVERFAAMEKKKIEGFSDQAKAALLGYTWPGNIRELENVVRRGVLLAEEPVIRRIVLPTGGGAVVASGRMKTIAENERDHILSALEKTNGKIFGRDGAARLLDINGSTLQSRMKKLGIDKKFIDAGGSGSMSPL